MKKPLCALLAALALAACASPGEEERPVRLTGTVVERSLAWSREGVPHQLAAVQSARRGLVMVDLGAPGGEGTLQVGDRVVVSGHPARLNGMPVLRASIAAETMNLDDRER